jgi:uncharacterized protein YxjI
MADPPSAPLTLNQKIMNFVQSKTGQKVGRGECWDLGEAALKYAGGHTSNDLSPTGPVGPDDDYVWGDQIDIKDVQAGDIIQLRDYIVTTETEIQIEFADGSGETVSKTETAKRPHHTAIANGKIDADGILKTYEQHVQPRGRVVQDKKLVTRDLGPTVTVTTERRANPYTKKVETAKVTTTVRVTTEGQYWVYRPKPK